MRRRPASPPAPGRAAGSRSFHARIPCRVRAARPGATPRRAPQALRRPRWVFRVGSSAPYYADAAAAAQGSMRYLLSSLVQIALLRKDPSVLPASVVLVVLTGIAFTVASALQSWILHGNDRLLGRTAYDLALTVALFWLLLTLTRHGNRFRQTMSAVFGTTVLMTPFAVVLLAIQAPQATVYAIKFLAWTGSVIVIVWYILVISHI